MTGMDLEELNKSQIVLLTLLVSFVTSIATGIVTTALIEKAPADVTRVVQRVVEHTIEQVTPASQQATVVTQEKTIVVKETDLITNVISENKGKIVAVIDVASAKPIALGVFVGSAGEVATDGAALMEGGAYAIRIGDSELLPATVLSKGGARGIGLLRISGDAVQTESVTFAEVGATLGQTVVAFAGVHGESIASGIVTTVTDGVIVTNIAGTAVVSGAPVFDMNGDLLALATGVSKLVDPAGFVPTRGISAQLGGVTAQTGEETSTETSESPAVVDETAGANSVQ